MISIGTRSSRLALAQAEQVAHELEERGFATELVSTDSLGDRRRSMPVHELGVAGAFTAGLERALLADEVDLAVHSLKDLPVEQPEDLTLAAVLERGTAADALLVRSEAHAEAEEEEEGLPLAEGARVATSGPRRQSQLLAERSDLAIVNVRGNVDTRVAKLRQGFFDALVTARVALDRLELDLADLHVHDLDPDRFPPAPGQAAIAVQAREGSRAAKAAKALDHAATRTAVATERRLLAAIGGGCGLPLGAHVEPEADAWRLRATFAGHGWDLADRGRLRRVEATAEDAGTLPEQVLDDVAAIQPRPTRPPYEPASAPEGPPVLVVASEPTARSWAAVLHEAGQPAEPLPTRRFTPTDPDAEATPDVAAADWIVATSPRAAEPLAGLLDDALDAYIAAVGPATARALQTRGLPCHLLGPEATGESLAEAIADVHEGTDGRVLLAQSDVVHGDAARQLEQAGFTVEGWQAYATEEQPVDLSSLAATLTAPAAIVMSARNAHTLAQADIDEIAERIVAIGPSTAEALREMGIDPLVASAPRPDAVLEVLDG